MDNFSLQLIAYGLQQSRKNETPDIVLLNTCVVTQKAEKETRQKIRELRKKYPESFLVVLGCAVTAREKIAIKLPEANLYVSNQDKNKIYNLITCCNSPCYSRIECNKTEAETYKISNFYNKYHLSGRKFIKIQDGCNGGCSFCLTQFLRGKSTSNSPEKIIEEINFWVEKGIKEIILTGINVGLYGKDFSSETPKYCCNRASDSRVHCNIITGLVKTILDETKAERITFSSIYPEMLTDKFLSVVVGNPRITQCFHLSLQSGSQPVLERMNRKTDLNRLLNKLKQIKEENKCFTLKADIITGFPEETEEEFLETLDFIKNAKISFVHHFLFSRRQHTKSEGMIRNKVWKEVPNEVKRQRAIRLKKMVEEVRKEEAKKMIGSETNCLIVKLLSCYLVEGLTENGILVRARDRDREKPAFAEASAGKGKIVPVKITDFQKNQLLGEIVSLPTN